MGHMHSTESDQSSSTRRGDSRSSRTGQSGGSGSRDASALDNMHGSVLSQRSSSAAGRASQFAASSNASPTTSSSASGFVRRNFPCSMPAVQSEPESLVYAPRVPNTFIRMPKELWEDSAIPAQPQTTTDAVMPVGFKITERQMLLTLWHEIASHTKNLAIKFYVSLITLHPEFRYKFAGDTIAADAHIQSHAMAALRYLINLANYIDDEEAFNESIHKVAEFHRELTMTKDDLLMFNNVFINMVIKELPDYMFPESAYALIMFLSTVTTRMYRHLVELQTGVRHSEDGARPTFTTRQRMSSTSEELYETITEWHIEVIHLHQRRLSMRSQMVNATASRTLGAILAPCVSNDAASHSSVSGLSKGRGKKK